jgi:hypothetical protein
MFFTGALFFMLSDSLLAINKFYRPFPLAGFLIMLSYIVAQYLIVIGTKEEVIPQPRNEKYLISHQPHFGEPRLLNMKKFLLFALYCIVVCRLAAQTQPSIVWEKSYGGTGDDEAFQAQQTSDGGFIVAGESYSNDNDVSGNHGASDYWIVKTDAIRNY